MTKPKDGGPAFPRGAVDAGMTLRDWFAGQALSAIAVEVDSNIHYQVRMRKVTQVVQLAYEFADEAIKKGLRGFVWVEDGISG